MNLYEMYQTDTGKERDKGVKLEFPGGAKIWVRRAGGQNTAYEKAIEAVMKPYRRQIRQNMLEEGKAQELEAVAYARGVILDWEGVNDEAGNTLDCTEENIVKLFTDLPDLFVEVKQQATDLSNFRREQQESDAKNSGKRSNMN